jgi:hypothetical protein
MLRSLFAIVVAALWALPSAGQAGLSRGERRVRRVGRGCRRDKGSQGAGGVIRVWRKRGGAASTPAGPEACEVPGC